MPTEKRVRPFGMFLLATAFKKDTPSRLQTPSFASHKRDLLLIMGLALISALVVFATVMAAPLLTPFLPLLSVVISALASWASTAIGQAALAAGITALATSACTALIMAIANVLTADTQMTTKPESGGISKDLDPITNPPDSLATIQNQLSAARAPTIAQTHPKAPVSPFRETKDIQTMSQSGIEPKESNPDATPSCFIATSDTLFSDVPEPKTPQRSATHPVVSPQSPDARKNPLSHSTKRQNEPMISCSPTHAFSPRLTRQAR